jgi:hypothetical protein
MMFGLLLTFMLCITSKKEIDKGKKANFINLPMNRSKKSFKTCENKVDDVNDCYTAFTALSEKCTDSIETKKNCL